MISRFLLGRIIIEDSVVKVLSREPLDLVARHAVLEHGLVNRRRVVLNHKGVMHRDSDIVSEYWCDPEDPLQGRIRVTTAADGSETVVSFVPPPKPPAIIESKRAVVTRKPARKTRSRKQAGE